MDEKIVLRVVKELADKLVSQGAVYTRADLAFELKSAGVECDSIEVSQWVYKAYSCNRNSEKIRKAFVNNEKKRYLVDEYCIYSLAEEENAEKLSNSLDDSLNKGRKALNILDGSIKKALSEKTIGKSAGIMGTIIGTKGVSDIQVMAASVFQRYTEMVNSYEVAKGEVKAIVSDFVCLRNYVNEIYCKYALALTDIFGDSIKAVSPELFDFDSIQYLDVQSMLKNVQLEYSQLMDKCGELMSTLSDNFSNSLNNASGIYRQAGNKKAGLMLAGIAMINHYINAGQQTNELHGQLLSLKNNVKHDAAQIKGDMGRLLLIYKGMNDFHIPRAEAFYQYSRQVFESGLNRLIESLYNNPELVTLKSEREKLLEQHKKVNRIISDSQFNIEYYTSHIGECESFIDSMKSQYTEAKQSKPSKPFFLLNLLSFGTLSAKYHREIAEWYQNCEPVITKYEDMQLDINLDKEDLTEHKKAYDESIEKMNVLNKKLELSSKKIRETINADKEVRTKIIPHLDTLIKLLWIAKEIIETKLDDRQRAIVTITDYRNETLPQEIEQNIQVFSRTLGEALTVDSSFARHSLDKIGDGIAEQYSDEDLQLVTQTQNSSIQNAVALFESWVNLQKKKVESDMTDEKYNAKLNKLRKEFQHEMQALGDKSTVLHKALKQLNLSHDEQQLKEGLFALTDRQDIFTDKDWDDFLNGTKIIEI